MDDDSDFFNDELRQSAILQKLIVIGEAASRLSPELCAAHPEVEWADIVGFRNIAVHRRCGCTGYNRKGYGMHFCGSLYSTCDPFFALSLSNCLRPDYVVWDKAATIDFVRSSRRRVTATIHIPPERVEAIRQEAAAVAAAQAGEHEIYDLVVRFQADNKVRAQGVGHAAEKRE